jgi:hypothetical protein
MFLRPWKWRIISAVNSASFVDPQNEHFIKQARENKPNYFVCYHNNRRDALLCIRHYAK